MGEEAGNVGRWVRRMVKMGWVRSGEVGKNDG